jgi:glyoxylate carboligase
VAKKGNFTFVISETALGSASANPNLNVVVHDCFLNSVSQSHSLDENASLDFSYTFPISNDAIEYYFS